MRAIRHGSSKALVRATVTADNLCADSMARVERRLLKRTRQIRSMGGLILDVRLSGPDETHRAHGVVFYRRLGI